MFTKFYLMLGKILTSKRYFSTTNEQDVVDPFTEIFQKARKYIF